MSIRCLGQNVLVLMSVNVIICIDIACHNGFASTRISEQFEQSLEGYCSPDRHSLAWHGFTGMGGLMANSLSDPTSVPRRRTASRKFQAGQMRIPKANLIPSFDLGGPAEFLS